MNGVALAMVGRGKHRRDKTLLSCPLCGGEMALEQMPDEAWQPTCLDCPHRGSSWDCRQRATDDHNRVAKAVLAHARLVEALEAIHERGCGWYADDSFTPVGTCLETDPEETESPMCPACIAEAALVAIPASEVPQ